MQLGACLLDGEGLEVAGEESMDVPAHAGIVNNLGHNSPHLEAQTASVGSLHH